MRITTSRWEIDKVGVSSRGGIVVAKHELATMAGAKVLEEGGNAVDAAVAAAFAIAVLEPYQNTIGGAGYMVYRPVAGEPAVVEFTGRAPGKATQEALRSRTGVQFSGSLALGVPGTVSGLATALERFGTISLERAVAPAVEIAREGMPLNFMLALRITQALHSLRANPDSARTYLVASDPPTAHGATVLRQGDLARTLEAIGREGPEVFYRGRIAEELVREVQERGGLLELADLADYQARVVPALRGRFRGYDLLGVPPPAPGLTTVESLQILEEFDLAGMGHNSAGALHLIAEAYRLAFADRDAYLGDPDFGEIPAEVLLSEAFTAERRGAIDPERAMSEVRPGDVGLPAAGSAGGDGGTTNICVVDAEGNAVAHTQTCIGGFESFGVAGNTGVILSSSLQWFDPNPGGPNSVAPGKRPLTNMTPMIVERDGRLALAVGAPGSRRITNAVSQVILNVLEYGLPAQEAISAPRIDLSTGRIDADDRLDSAVIDELRGRGHDVNVVHEFLNYGGPGIGLPGFTGYFARPNAIHVDDEDIRHGGDYPFAYGTVAALDEA